VSHPHRRTNLSIGPRTDASRTRQDLLRQLEMRSAEAGIYFVYLSQLLYRSDGEAVITMAEANEIPTNSTIWSEQINDEGDVRIWLAPPPEEEA
jgi:hypothetical protein